MQAVGRTCAVCDERIAWAVEGLACPACAAAYHYRCLDPPADAEHPPERCPACARAYDLMELEAELAQVSAATRAARRRGGWRVLGFLALALVTLGTAGVIFVGEVREQRLLSRSGEVFSMCLLIIGIPAFLRFLWEAYHYLRRR